MRAWPDDRGSALRVVAASLVQLEAMVGSDIVTDAEVDAAEVAFEEKVKAFVELDKTLSAACESALAECHLAMLTVAEAENMAKA